MVFERRVWAESLVSDAAGSREGDMGWEEENVW